MCGIAGLLDPRLAASEIQQTLARMTASLVHRGPDDHGAFHGDGVGIGMRRLSIMDVAGGHQPLSNEDGSVHLICNGEIYNHEELRQQLTSRGHRFRTRSDSEVIVHLYEEKGADFPSELRGMFAIAIWDTRRQRLVLARDRLGKKPLFFALSHDRLLFGSEIKALLSADPTLAESDSEALVSYLRFGFVPEPRTMFRRVKKLSAANILVHEAGETSIRRYWNLDFAPDASPSIDGQQWRSELEALLEESVAIRLMSEVPLGVFLSGGLDSSAIVAFARRSGLDPLKTFTIGFDRPEWDESHDAEIVAKHFGTEHHVLRLTEGEIKQSLPETLFQLVRHFDEPFADQSSLPTYMISKLAREYVTVILSGDGGDELFAGYNTYQGIKFSEYYRQLPHWLGARLMPWAAERAAAFLPQRHQDAARRVRRVLRESYGSFKQSYYDKSSVFGDDVLRRVLRPELHALIGPGTTHFPSHIEPIFEEPWPTLNQQSCVDLRLHLLEGMLVKVDRMSMAHSLEVRSPFLDHRLVELAARMPPAMKLRVWEKKAVLRDVLRPMLPTRTLRKPKQGFRVPLREWLRTSFDELCGDLLESQRGSLPGEIFEGDAVGQLAHAHRTGRADHSRELWALLNYAAWHEQYIDDGRAGVAAGG
ncbi:MAG: asparagine synthase (glutamine-hydrolyzing) [Myxococcales bacterium]|nr:asparagine synthase (glutamine-hydrolyzing) [Myxococcales bacterium]